MYEIRPESVKTFITDNSITLPRFQRKQTWDEKKNFQLCISVFKDYPMGVCILNLEGAGRNRPRKYLLDGRQRRNALKQMYENPETIGLWAKKFLGAPNSIDEIDLKEIFDERINEYLELDEEADSSNENDENTETLDVLDDNDTEEDDDSSYGGGMELLFHIVKLTYKRNKHSTGFSKPFDYTSLITDLPYVDLGDSTDNNSYVLNGKKLKSFIDEYHTYCDNEGIDYLEDWESFYNYIIKRGRVIDNNKGKKLKQKIQTNWNSIVDRMEIIDKVDSILTNCKIGLIEVKDYKPADSQKIFNIINSEGVKLTAVEILSASMAWNRKINNPSPELLSKVQELYMNMNPTFKPTDVCRWDIPATLISRLGKNIIFKQLSWDSIQKKAEFEKKLTLGFKLLSGIYEKGIKKDDIDKLGKDGGIDWGVQTENTISELNTIIKLIEQIEYFKFFKSWNTTIMEITSDAIALDFLLVLYFDWKRKGSPIGSSAKTAQFQKNAFILWDQLIFEYVNKLWRGSSDSIVAANIRNIDEKRDTIPDVFKAIELNKWQSLLKEIYDSATINDSPVSVILLKPILYHIYCLKKMHGPNALAIEVDHILPQAILSQSGNPKKDYIMHNLYNLGLLPKKENISKGEKRLKEITDSWLQDQIVEYEFIEKTEFDKYSNVSNYKDMFDKRKAIFEKAFTEDRKTIIDN